VKIPILLFLVFSLLAADLPAQISLNETIAPERLTAEGASWKQALAGTVIGRPVAQAESVVVATDGGSLKSYSTHGLPLWDYYARGRLSPNIARSMEGTSYICRTNGRFIAINRTGRELWALELGAPLIYPVLIGWDGRLFAFTQGKITCMTAAGYVLWTKALAKRIAIAPFMDVAGGFVFVYEDGEVLRIDPFGNASAYRPPAGAVPVAAVSVEIDEPILLLFYEDNHMELVYIFASDRDETSVRVRLELPSPPLAAAAINASGIRALGKKDEVAVLLGDGKVALLSTGKSEVLWTAESHVSPGEFGAGRPELEFFYDERGVYVLSKSGATGFTPDGRRLWIVHLTDVAAVPSFSDDGVLYSGGADWILYAYRLENRARAKHSLLYGEAPEGSYGTGTPDPSFSSRNYLGERGTELRLAEIRGAIRDGTVGTREKEYATWLMETAGSLIAAPGRSVILQPVHVTHRIEAARILAYIGSRETIPFLTDLFNRDPEVLVKAAAAEAIGRIGVDPEGIALRSFERVFFPPFPGNNEVLLSAVAAATGALCRFSGPPLSAAGVRLLVALTGDDKPPATRRRAQTEIRSL